MSKKTIMDTVGEAVGIVGMVIAGLVITGGAIAFSVAIVLALIGVI